MRFTTGQGRAPAPRRYVPSSAPAQVTTGQGNAPAPVRATPRATRADDTGYEQARQYNPVSPRGIRPASVRGAATRRMPRNARY